jgi:hypothetical protein
MSRRESRILNLMIKLSRPMLALAMRRVLQDRLPPEKLEQVIQDTWRNYDDQAQNLPVEPTLGARVMVRLAAMTVGLHNSLRQAGLTEEEARENVAGHVARVRETDGATLEIHRIAGEEPHCLRALGDGLVYAVPLRTSGIPDAVRAGGRKHRSLRCP